MTNGQLNVASACSLTQLANQKPAAPVAETMDGAQQSGGSFGRLLGGIELQAKGKAQTASGQTEQLLIKGDHDQLTTAGAEDSTPDLLALLQVSPIITAVSEPAAPKSVAAEKTDVCVAAAPQHYEPSDLDSQMVMAAYSQPGRMPEAKTQTLLTINMPQNVATATEQPAAIAAPIVDKHVGPVAAESLPATPSQSGQSDRMSAVNEMTILPVDELQNAATPSLSERPALSSVSPDKTQVKQAPVAPIQATPVQAPATLVVQVAVILPQAGNGLPQGTSTADLSVKPVEKPSAPVTLQSEQQAANLATPLPAPSPESELEIQLSQPQPITARVTASVRLQHGPEQQLETVRTGNEHSVAKEMVTSPPVPAVNSESTLGSDSSSNSDSNQKQSDVSYDNQMLTQNLQGQHQKVSTTTAKSVPTEPVQQDVPGQIMQQVKERLMQQDVKPGNQQITLTLSPDSLGEIKMNLNLQGQKLSVEIVTENRAVRDAIVQHTDALKESLARQNITMESFDVTTGGKGSGNQGQNQNAWRELAKQQQQQSWTPPRGYQTAQADIPSGQLAFQRQKGQTMLDIHY